MRPKVIWLFGLSGAGKTTLSNYLKTHFDTLNVASVQLDGDSLRLGINNDLGFTPKDRSENIRRIAEIAKIFLETGFIPIVSAITPYEKDRVRLTKIIGENNLLKFFLDCALSTCESRDGKGLYKKARKQEINFFTGIHDVFEIPGCDCIRINTNNIAASKSAYLLISAIYEHP